MRRRVREEEEVGELNIVPYLDIVTNLVIFMLLSMVGLLSLGVIDVGSPKLGEPPPPDAQQAQPNPEEKSLTLTVAVTDAGFYVAGAGGVLGGDPAADKHVDTKQPPTVPMKGGQYDYPGLTEVMSRVKDGFPKETRVIMLAEMDTPYDVVISTMDACREKVLPGAGGLPTRKQLFPDVWLSSLVQ